MLNTSKEVWVSRSMGDECVCVYYLGKDKTVSL